MKKKIVFLLFIILLQSCVKKDTHTGFRIVGNDGRIIYLDKKRPSFNEDQLNKKKKLKETNSIKKVQELDNKNIVYNINNEKKQILTDSSAYTLKSVMDSTINDNESKMALAKKLEKNDKQKTINDFNYIPEYYFSDNIKSNSIEKKESIKTDINIPKQVEINNNKKFSFFARIFGKKNNNKDEVNSKKDKKINKRLKNKNNDIKEKTIDKENINLEKIIINKKQKTGKSNLKQDLEKIEKNVEDEKKSEKINTTNYVKINNKNTGILKKENKLDSANNTININALSKNKYYIQLGSFVSSDKAQNLINKFPNIGTKSFVVMVNINNKIIFRSIIGEFNSKTDAEKEMEKIIIKGHYDVYIFKK